MCKEKFEYVLNEKEEIKWAGSVNKKAYIIKNTISMFFISLFYSILIGAFIGGPMTAVKNIETASEAFSLIFSIVGLIFVIVMIIGAINNILNAQNTYFAITDKRIIKRSGVFNNKFINYSLKNIGTVVITNSFFDSKGENGSGNLSITVKDYHLNTSTNTGGKLQIISLNQAYEAYKLLNDLTEGNNEVIRIKEEQ